MNPLTGSHVLPTEPGDILNAAIAYWEDELFEWRAKRPRQAAVKQEKQRRVSEASERLDRFRSARARNASNPRDLDSVSLQLATSDLRKVMKVGAA
ncbi:MAG: hypothetical protein EKK42_20295 [Pseudonocardiaceae bacterium]|nr:MAG: hypothetical protein EKK42_20295 [Pseudonocardiaceae bacterium]